MPCTYSANNLLVVSIIAIISKILTSITSELFSLNGVVNLSGLTEKLLIDIWCMPTVPYIIRVIDGCGL